jgi:hypothetical protein
VASSKVTLTRSSPSGVIVAARLGVAVADARDRADG